MHTKSVSLMTSMRAEAGLCGEVTSGPLTPGAMIPKVEGSVTILLQGMVSKEKHGVRHMPELSMENMGPVYLNDNTTVWSRVLSNGVHSLRWYSKFQNLAESNAMGAKMRQDYCAYSHKSKYPGFAAGVQQPDLHQQQQRPRGGIVCFPPLFDACNDEVVIFDEAMSELAWSGAELTRIEARALFCALYARIAVPALYDVRRRIQRGVSFHVAGSFTFTEDAATHFRDTADCSFKEASCVVCILQGLAPWDDYIRERFAAVEAANDAHAVFTAIVCLFFGDRFKHVAAV